MRVQSCLFILIVFGLILGCVQPFKAESFDFEKVLVVDGIITDEMKTHEVLLSYTSPIGADVLSPLSNADIWVETQAGDRIDFVESAPGRYLSVDQFAAEERTTYQLNFITPDGLAYVSDKSELIKSPPIDSIYQGYSELASDEAVENVGGIQFFTNTNGSDQAKYFRFEWQEDYIVTVPFPSRYLYNDSLDIFFPRISPVRTCYLSETSKSLIIGNSTGSKGNVLSEMPVRFVSGETDILRNRYAILVKQYAVSESAYSFYRKLKESSESGGSLFDKQQGTIVGNVSSIDDPEETVLGYFEVSGVSTLRRFFSYEDLDKDFPYPSFRYLCSSDVFIETTLDSIGYYLQRRRTYEIITASREDNETVLGVENCSDCTSFASSSKPSFWID